MENKQNPRRRDPRAARTPRNPAQAEGGSDAIFDSWLENKLKSAYSSVLEEPIPEDLIELLARKLKD